MFECQPGPSDEVLFAVIHIIARSSKKSQNQLPWSLEDHEPALCQADPTSARFGMNLPPTLL